MAIDGKTIALIVGFAVVAYSFFQGCDVPPPLSSAGDDWRRTATGWEHVGHWEHPIDRFNLPLPAHSDKAGRFDTHPAVLALLQLVVALLALNAFPRIPARAASSSGNLVALLARSFRASAFG
jgi:hypothetical protein